MTRCQRPLTVSLPMHIEPGGTTMSPTQLDPRQMLSDDMLARFDERATGYDRDNSFFHEDWEELRESGYLLAAVPVDMGGAGLALDDVVRLQSRLAYYAAPTALAVNMHIY